MVTAILCELKPSVLESPRRSNRVTSLTKFFHADEVALLTA